MKFRILSLLAFVTLLAVSLTACGNAQSAAVEGTWKLASYGPVGNLTPAAADIDTSIKFAENKVEGNVGCNGFGGDYKVEGNQITFDQIISTLMFCDGPGGAQETVTFNVLTGTATFERQADTLTITSADGQSVIVLAPK